MFNTDSMHYTAHIHTNKIGDFKTPMYFGRVLPHNHSPHGMGVSAPPMGSYGVIIPQYRGEIAKSTPMLDRFAPIFG